MLSTQASAVSKSPHCVNIITQVWQSSKEKVSNTHYSEIDPGFNGQISTVLICPEGSFITICSKFSAAELNICTWWGGT